MHFVNDEGNGLNQFEEQAPKHNYNNDYSSDEVNDPPLLEDLGISKLNIL